MANDVYTAGMGQPPVEDDMGSIEALRGKRGMAAPVAPRRPVAPPMAGKRPVANPADAGVYTADKGMPPSPDDMGSMQSLRPKTPRQMKARGDMRAAMGMKKGGSVSSASKRADGIAKKGKTKGRMV